MSPPYEIGTGLERIPFADLAGMHRPLMSDFDAVWEQVSRTGGFIGGPLVDQFEAEWAAYCGRRHCIGVANGTDAITLALRALGVGRGDEVLVPDNTFIASAEGVVHAGATPVFVDVDPVSRLADVATMEAAVNERTAAVLVVHLYGHLPDMGALVSFAERRGLLLIEDAAQAHGARWKGRPAGSFGAAAAFSFYPGKNLGAFGDGGAVVLDDDAATATIRCLANHGRSEDDKYVHPRLGVNSRLDALQAGVLSVKLRQLDAWTRQRRNIADAYVRELRALDPKLADRLVLPIEGCESAWHLLVVEVEARARIMEELQRSGIATGIHYPVPCHRQRIFASVHSPACPVSDRSAARVMSLPMFPHMTSAQIAVVCAALVRAVRSGRPG